MMTPSFITFLFSAVLLSNLALTAMVFKLPQGSPRWDAAVTILATGVRISMIFASAHVLARTAPAVVVAGFIVASAIGQMVGQILLSHRLSTRHA